jgi:L,D-transpeptidase catalytic domain
MEFALKSRVPETLKRTVLRLGVRPTRHLLAVSVANQRMALFERISDGTSDARFPNYQLRRRFVISTSRFGVGQKMNSKQTPLGLHRIARKIGGGCPVGTVFKGRVPIGFLGQGQAESAIVHRILWLEGLEPGLNRGGDRDTFSRYVYLHGFSDETTLGRPQSSGCIHLAATDLIPLYDRIVEGTLVWIAER